MIRGYKRSAITSRKSAADCLIDSYNMNNTTFTCNDGFKVVVKVLIQYWLCYTRENVSRISSNPAENGTKQHYSSRKGEFIYCIELKEI